VRRARSRQFGGSLCDQDSNACAVCSCLYSPRGNLRRVWLPRCNLCARISYARAAGPPASFCGRNHRQRSAPLFCSALRTAGRFPSTRTPAQTPKRTTKTGRRFAAAFVSACGVLHLLFRRVARVLLCRPPYHLVVGSISSCMEITAFALQRQAANSGARTGAWVPQRCADALLRTRAVAAAALLATTPLACRRTQPLRWGGRAGNLRRDTCRCRTATLRTRLTPRAAFVARRPAMPSCLFASHPAAIPSFSPTFSFYHGVCSSALCPSRALHGFMFQEEAAKLAW